MAGKYMAGKDTMRKIWRENDKEWREKIRRCGGKRYGGKSIHIPATRLRRSTDHGPTMAGSTTTSTSRRHRRQRAVAIQHHSSDKSSHRSMCSMAPCLPPRAVARYLAKDLPSTAHGLACSTFDADVKDEFDVSQYCTIGFNSILRKCDQERSTPSSALDPFVLSFISFSSVEDCTLVVGRRHDVS